MGKSKVKKCHECQGQGLVIAIQGFAVANGVEANEAGYGLCSKCRGTGITGIKQLETMDQNSLAKLTRGKSFHDLYSMLNNKSDEELKVILAPY